MFVAECALNSGLWLPGMDFSILYTTMPPGTFFSLLLWGMRGIGRDGGQDLLLVFVDSLDPGSRSSCVA